MVDEGGVGAGSWAFEAPGLQHGVCTVPGGEDDGPPEIVQCVECVWVRIVITPARHARPSLALHLGTPVALQSSCLLSQQPYS